MRFLNFLPLAAALVAAAPAAQPPTKDLVKRDANLCSGKGTESTKGCAKPDDNHKYDYSTYDVEGVILYDVKFEGTLEYYEVSFTAYNPNTNWYTPCKSGVQNTKDYQRCERIRTAFVVNIDDREIVTRETATVYVKLVWVYAEGALPRAIKKKNGKNQDSSKDHDDDENEYKNLIYYQIGELTFQITCTKDSKTTIGSEKPKDNLICEGDYCYAKPYEQTKKEDKDDSHKQIAKTETHVSCHFQGELKVAALILKKGDWNGKDE